MVKYTKEEIRAAVDIAIGDDGFRSKEVIAILEMWAKEKYENKMTKEQWLNQTIQFDEWGRPPSLADVPLTIMTRKTALFKRNIESEIEINKLYKESKNG